MSKPWAEMTAAQKAAHYERVKRYRATEKARVSRNAANRRYRAEHPEFAEAQRLNSAAYYRENRAYLRKQNNDRYRRNRAAILARQRDGHRDYKRRKRDEHRAEESAIAGYMAGVEQDATSTQAIDLERLGFFPITKRLDKRARGTSAAETVALRLAARKGVPLMPEPEQVRIGFDRDEPDFHGPRYHAHATIGRPKRGPKPVDAEAVTPDTGGRWKRPYRGFAGGKWAYKRKRVQRAEG